MTAPVPPDGRRDAGSRRASAGTARRAEAARSPWLARVLTDNQLLVGPMEATQLRRAVIGPAEYAGLEVDERLVEAVLAEMGDDPA